MHKRSLAVVYALVPMLGCAATATANVVWHFFRFPYYADYSWVSNFIANSTMEPRWLIHLKLQTATFHVLNSMNFARAFMPAFVRDPLSLARAFNMLLLVSAALHCYAFYPRLRVTIGWVITSAAYCFMATGYAKVYGAATAVLLMLYCFLAESDFDVDGPSLGATAAVVGLYYLALLPIALAMLLTLAIKRRQAFLPAVLTFIVAGYVLIAIFWGQDVPAFFSGLWAESHFGNEFTDYVPYRGQASSENSIFFTLPFMFSMKHLKDMLYMLFFSGTLLSLAGACYELARFVLGRRGLIERLARLSPMMIFCCLSFAAYTIIVFGYLSKIGPRGDLPFYSPYVVPFTFMWFQLRRLRRTDDIWSGAAWIGQYVYMMVIVVWSAIVGPPEI
jgi:hypothetical protein